MGGVCVRYEKIILLSDMQSSIYIDRWPLYIVLDERPSKLDDGLTQKDISA